MSTILRDIEASRAALVSHHSATRKELNSERPYTRADKDERSDICIKMVENLSRYVAESEDISTMQLAAVMSIINNLLALRRALSVFTSQGSFQPYGKSQKSRDILSASLDSCRSIFLEEELAKLDTIPEYFGPGGT